MNETTRYEIRTVQDFFAIPAEKREACLTDFALWLEVMSSEMMTALEGIDGVRGKREVFGWVDDGKHDGIFSLNIRSEEPRGWRLGDENLRKPPLGEVSASRVSPAPNLEALLKVLASHRHIFNDEEWVPFGAIECAFHNLKSEVVSPAPETDAERELAEVNELADRYARAHGGYVGNAKGVLLALLDDSVLSAPPPAVEPLDLEPIKAHLRAACWELDHAVVVKDWEAIPALAFTDVPALLTEVERLQALAPESKTKD